MSSVVTKVDIYPGLPHAFGYFPSLSASATLGKDLARGIKLINQGKLGN